MTGEGDGATVVEQGTVVEEGFCVAGISILERSLVLWRVPYLLEGRSDAPDTCLTGENVSAASFRVPLDGT